MSKPCQRCWAVPAVRGKLCRACNKDVGTPVASGSSTWRNRLRRKARDRAKASGVEFNLKVADIHIPEVCPVFGIKLTPGVEGGLDSCASIDRIDNSKGYTKDNIRVISFRANRLKSQSTVDELRAIIEYMEGRPRF